MTLRRHVVNWHKKPWAWKQGWLYYKRDPWNNDFAIPHKRDTVKYIQFDEGWNEAAFWDKAIGGYFDG